jgi:hypothetical protein
VQQSRSVEACLHACLAPGAHLGEDDVPNVSDATTARDNACNEIDACRSSRSVIGSWFTYPGRGFVSVCRSRPERQGRACRTPTSSGYVDGRCLSGECVTKDRELEFCWRAIALTQVVYFWGYALPPLNSTGKPYDVSSWAEGAVKSMRQQASAALRSMVDGSDDGQGCWTGKIPHWDGRLPLPSRMPEP